MEDYLKDFWEAKDSQKSDTSQGQSISNPGTDIASFMQSRNYSSGFKDPYNTMISRQPFEDYVNSFRAENGYEYNRKLRALGQSNLEQFGNALARTLGIAVLETVGNIGSILDLEDYFNTNDEVGNWLTNIAQQGRQGIEEALPIYRENPHKHFDVGDFAYWMENGSSIAGSALSFVATGYGSGAAAMKILKSGTKAKNWLTSADKALTGLTAEQTSLVNKGAKGLNSLLLNQAEGIGVATNVYNDTYERALAQYDDINGNSFEGTVKNNQDQTREQYAKERASAAAEYAMNINRLNIALNLSSAGMFVKGNTLTRQTFRNPSMKHTAKALGYESAQEYLEEDINLISEKAAAAKDMGNDFGYNEIVETLASQEGIEAGFFGALGGFGQTALTAAGKNINRLGVKEDGKWKSRNAVERERYNKQQEDIQKLNRLTEENNLPNVTDVFNNTNETIGAYIAIQEAMEEGNTEKAENLSNILLESRAYESFNNGTTEQLLNTLDYFVNMDEDVAKSKGVHEDGISPDSKNYYKNKAIEAVRTVKQLENIYYQTRDNFNANQVYHNRATDLRLNKLRENIRREKGENETAVLNSLQNAVNSGKIKDFYDITDVDKNIDRRTFNYTVDNLQDNKEFETYNEEGKQRYQEIVDYAVNNIPEYVDFLMNKSVEESVNEAIDLNNKEYNTITSDEYARKVERKIRDNQRKQQQAKNKEKARNKKKVNDEKLTNTVSSVENTVTKDENGEIKEAGEAKTNIDSTKTKVTDTSKGTKTTFLGNVKEGIESMKAYSKVQQLAGLNMALEQAENVVSDEKDEAIKLIQDRINELTEGNENPNDVIDDIDNDDNEFFTLEGSTDSDESQFTSDKKVQKRIDFMKRLLRSLEPYDVKSFSDIALYTASKVGKDKFIRMFDKFKATYTMVTDKTPTDTLESLFFSPQAKKIFGDSVYNLSKNPNSEDYYNSDSDAKVTQDQKKRSERVFNHAVHMFDTGEDGNLEYDGQKVWDGVRSAAYLSRKYQEVITKVKGNTASISKQDIDDLLNDGNLDILIHDINEYQPGTKITLEVDTDYLRTYKEGNEEKVETFETLRQKGLRNDIGRFTGEEAAFIPIAIKKNGVKFAYLHDLNWINDSRVSGDVIKQREDLMTIRRKLLMMHKNGEVYNTTITRKSYGKLIKSTNGVASTKERFPDKNLKFGIMKQGELLINGEQAFDNDTNEVLGNENRIDKEGWLFAILPIGKKENKTVYLPVPLNKNKISDEYAKSARLAVEAWYYKDAENPVVKKLAESGYNILTNKGLREYLSNFMYSFNDYHTNKSLDEVAPTLRSNTYLAQVTGNSIDFVRGHGFSYNSISRNTPNRMLEPLLDKFEEHLKQMYIRFNINKLEDTAYELPIIHETGEVYSVKNSYTDHIKQNTVTDLTSIELPNGNYTYTVQPVIQFNIDELLGLENTLEPEVVAEEAKKNETPETDNEIDEWEDSDLAEDDEDLFDTLSPINIITPSPTQTSIDVNSVFEEYLNGDILTEEKTDIIQNNAKAFQQYIESQKAKNNTKVNNKAVEEKTKHDSQLVLDFSKDVNKAVETVVEEQLEEEDKRVIAEEENITEEEVVEVVSNAVKESLNNGEQSTKKKGRLGKIINKILKYIRNAFLGASLLSTTLAYSPSNNTYNLNNFVETTTSVLPDYAQQSAIRFFAKTGLYDPTVYEETVDTSKVKEAPVIDLEEVKNNKEYKEKNTFTEIVGKVKDSHYKARKGKNDSLVMIRNQFFNDEGFTYISGGVKSRIKGNEKITNVEGVAHFMILDDSGVDLTTKTSDEELKEASKQFKTRIGKDIKLEDYVPVFKRDGNSVSISYKKASDINEDDTAITRLHQYKFGDINFNAKSDGKKFGFKSGTVFGLELNDGTVLPNFVYTTAGKDAYSRFSGASVVFIFEDSKGNTIVRDFTGSINMIQNEGKSIASTYGVDISNLTIGVYDAGSYTAKPAAKDGTLETDQYKGYNVLHPNSGGALIIPKNSSKQNNIPIQSLFPLLTLGALRRKRRNQSSEFLTLDNDSLQALKDELKDSVIIRGLNSVDQESLVKYAFYIINKLVLDNDTKNVNQNVTFKNALNSFKQKLENNKEKVLNSGTQQQIDRLVPKMDIGLQNVNKIFQLAINRFRRVQGYDIKVDEDVNIDDLVEALEDTSFQDDSSFKIDSKRTISGRLRSMFSIVPDYKFKEDGSYKQKLNKFGLPEMVGSDEVYNTIIELLVGVNPDMQSIYDRLEQYKSKLPFVNNVISILKTSSQQQRNEFQYAMRKHYSAMSYTYHLPSKGVLVPADSDVSSKTKIINKRWKANLGVKPFVQSINIATDSVAINKENKHFENSLNLFEATKKNLSNKKTAISNLNLWLNSIGINMHPAALEHIYNNGIFFNRKHRKFDTLFSANSLFGIINKNLQKEWSVTLDQNHPFNDTAITVLAKLEAKYNKSFLASSGRDGEGNLINYYNNSRFFVDRFFELTSNPEKIEALRQLPFNRNSYLLEELANAENPKDVIDYFYIDSYTNGDEKRGGTKMKNAERLQHELTKISHFQNSGNTKAKMFVPTFSDKSVPMGLELNRFPVSFGLDDKLDDTTIDTLYNILVQPEVDRILRQQKIDKNSNIKGFDTGKNMFFIIPQLNDVFEAFMDDWTITETKDGMVFTNGSLDESVLLMQLKDKFTGVMRNVISKNVDEKLKLWEKLGISKNPEKYMNTKYYDGISVVDGKNRLKFAAADMVLNYMMFNTNIFQAFTGDPALYYKSSPDKSYVQQAKDTYNNIGKRLALYNANGQHLAESTNDSYGIVILKDRVIPSKHIEEYKKVLGKAGADFNKINSTDAQEYCTLKEYLDNLIRSGKITDKDAKRIETRNRVGDLKIDDLNILLQGVDKPVQGGNLIDAENETEIVLYVKSSVIPLISSMTKGLEIDKLREFLERLEKRDGINYRAPYESAVKVGGVSKPLNIYNDDGTIKDLSRVKTSDVIRKVPRTFFKIQQGTPAKESTEINNASQPRKLLFRDKRGMKGMAELEDKYNKRYSELYKIHKEAFRRELKVDDRGNIDLASLSKIIEKEAIERNYNINEIKGLKVVNDRFVLPLHFQSSPAKIEALLSSLTDNKIRKLKINGTSLILVSEEGFKHKDNIQSFDELSSKDRNKIVYTKNYNVGEGLKHTTIKGNKVQYAQVLVPFKFKDNNGKKIDIKTLMDENGFIDDAKLPVELRKMFGFRIPNQTDSSDVLIEIVGFLPEEFGDKIIAPRELTVQMGSDFDVDKLYAYLKNYYVEREYSNTKYTKEDWNREYKEWINTPNYSPKADKEIVRAAIEDFDADRAKREFANALDIYYNPEDDVFYDTVNSSSLKEIKFSTMTELMELNDTLIRNKIKLQGDNNLTDIENLYKKGLENDIIDIHFKVFSDPEIAKRSLKPLDFGDIPALADRLYAVKENEDYEYFTGVSENYQSEKYFNARDGKAGIGNFSNDSVFLASIQNKDVRYGYMTRKGFFDKVIKFGDFENNTPSNETLSNAAKFKSDAVSAVQSVTVDNENLQLMHKINLSKDTFGVVSLLITIGFDENIWVPFINQPIIKDYLDYRSSVSGENSKGKAEMLARKYISDKYSKNTYDPKNDRNLAEVSADTMFNMIEQEYDIDNVDLNNIQLAILDRYIELDRDAQKLKYIQTVVNTDSAGISPSLMESELKFDAVLELFNETTFLNVHEIIGDYYTPNYSKEHDSLVKNGYIKVGRINGKDLYIKPTTINGFATINALFENNNAWSKLFPYNKTNIKNLINSIEDKANSKELEFKDRLLLRRQITNALKAWSFSSKESNVYDGDLLTRKRQIFIDTFDEENNYINKSLATILAEISDSNFYQSNSFLNNLVLEPGIGINISMVKFPANMRENIEESNIHQGFADLFANNVKLGNFNGKEYFSSDLAVDLIDYQLLKGGIQEANEYIKYIPIEYYVRSGVAEGLHNIIDKHYNNPLFFDSVESDGFVPSFIIQFFQHNPQHIGYEDNYSIIEVDENENPKIIAIENNDRFFIRAKGDTFDSLYMSDGMGTYKRINIVGSRGFMEYHPNRVYAESIIERKLLSDTTAKELDASSENQQSLKEYYGESYIEYDNNYEESTVDKYGLSTNEPMKDRIQNVLSKIAESSESNLLRVFANTILDNSSKLNDVIVKLDDNLSTNGSYLNGVITLRRNYDSNLNFELSFMHELLHAVTIPVINNPTTEAEKAAVKKLEALFANLRNRISDEELKAFKDKYKKFKDSRKNKSLDRAVEHFTNREKNIIYAANSLEEYIALAGTSPMLQKLLNNTTDTSGNSFFDKLVELFNQLLEAIGIKRNSELDSAVKSILSLIIGSGDVEVNNSSSQASFKPDRSNLIHHKNINEFEVNNVKYKSLHHFIETVKTDKFDKEYYDNYDVENPKDSPKEGIKSKMIEYIKYALGNKAVMYPEINRELLEDNVSMIILDGDDFYSNEYAKILNQFVANNNPYQSSKNEISFQSEDVIKLYKLEDDNGNLITKYDENLGTKIIQKYPNVNVAVKKVGDGYTFEVTDRLYLTLDSDSRNPADHNRKSRIAGSLISRRKLLYGRLYKAEMAKNFALRDNIQLQIDNITKDLEEIGTELRLEDLQYFSSRDFIRLENMLDNGISLEEVRFARRIINTWINAVDIFFDESEKESDMLVDEFREIEKRAKKYEVKLNKIEIDHGNNLIKKFGVDGDIVDMMSSGKDVDTIASNTLDISRVGKSVFDLASKIYKLSSYKTQAETEKLLENHNELMTKVKPILDRINKENGYKHPYEIFIQKYNTGEKTGNLVYRYTQEFFDEKNYLFENAKRGNTASVWTKYKNWSKNNELVLDVRKLFPTTDESSYKYLEEKFPDNIIEDYKKEVKDNLGEKGYEVIMKQLEKKVNKFIEEYEVMKDTLNENELEVWEKENSPYYYARNINDAKLTFSNDEDKKRLIPNKGYRYLITVPLKYKANGEETGWYDKSFDIIENNDTLSEFYNYLINTIYDVSRFIPRHKRRGMQINTLPQIPKRLVEEYGDAGIMGALGGMYDNLMRGASVNGLSDVIYDEPDPITGEVDKEINLPFKLDNNAEVEARIEEKVLKYRAENGSIPNIGVVLQFEKEAKDEIARNRSFDLGRIVKLFALSAISYKNKSEIEDYLLLVKNVLNNVRETNINPSGEVVTKEDGTAHKFSKEESFTNMKSMYDFFVDNFYGKSRTLERVGKKKLLTFEEIERKKELELALQDALDKDDRELALQIERKIENLGQNIVASKVGDSFLKFMQLKGMGWNLYSAFSNMGFGFIANFITAADGRSYTRNQMWKAYKMTLNSIGRNLTFHSLDDSSNAMTREAIKIRSLMDKLDVLKDASNELYSTSKESTINKRSRFLEPYNLQKRSEYVNQASVLIAMMFNTKMTDIDGNNDRNLYEAFNDDGTWNVEEFGEQPEWMNDNQAGDKLNEFRLNVDAVIKMNHGNYDPDSPIKLKDKFFGRAIVQFRTWMLEGWANRIEKEKYDMSLGYNRKGRYITAWEALIKGGELSEHSGISNIAFTLKQLLRKATFRNTKFDDRFDEVDAANMRKNITELMMYVNIVSMITALTALAGGDDDDEKEGMLHTANYIINHLQRLQTDIAFYANPSEFEALIKNAVPLTSLFTDTLEWLDAAGRFIIGDDKISTGYYSGDSRLLRETAQMLPFGTQVYRNYAAANRIFDN